MVNQYYFIILLTIEEVLLYLSMLRHELMSYTEPWS